MLASSLRVPRGHKLREAIQSADRIFSVDFFADSEPEPIQDNFQLEVSYAYIDRNEAHRNDYFLLDFVAFDKLTEFGNAIDNGAKAAAFLASD